MPQLCAPTCASSASPTASTPSANLRQRDAPNLRERGAWRSAAPRTGHAGTHKERQPPAVSPASSTRRQHYISALLPVVSSDGSCRTQERGLWNRPNDRSPQGLTPHVRGRPRCSYNPQSKGRRAQAAHAAHQDGAAQPLPRRHDPSAAKPARPKRSRDDRLAAGPRRVPEQQPTQPAMARRQRARPGRDP